MATLANARKLADRVVTEYKGKVIDRILVFGSLAEFGVGNDIDMIVIIKRGNGKSQEFFYNDIYRKVVSPFIKQEAIGVDLFVWSINKAMHYNKNGSPFLKLIQKKGKVIYMSGDYEQEWFKFAKDSYEMTGVLLMNGHYRGACYHAQQAIEKCLKGLLIKKKWELERTHNIGALVSLAASRDIVLDIKDEDIEFIDSIYRGRYPAEEGLLPYAEPDKEAALKAFRTAESVLNQSQAFSDIKPYEHFLKNAVIVKKQD